MTKIFHLSDLHIKNYKLHDEFKHVSEKLKEYLHSEKPEHIIITGDLFHNKNKISPEAYNHLSEFLKLLLTNSDIPIHIIAGNHDAALKNKNRLDAITPIVNSFENDRIKYYVKSGKYCLNDEICLHVLSLLDKSGWNFEDIDENKINIGLYHGAIIGTVSDTGWTIDRGDLDVDKLACFDYVMLGDIHKANQKVDDDGKIRYAGAFMQGNHGETDDKGFLIWDIAGKNDYKVKQIIIPNPSPFFTIRLEENNNIPNDLEIPNSCKMRIISQNRIPQDLKQLLKSSMEEKYNPQEISFIENKFKIKEEDRLVNKNFKKENLRDIKTQEHLIRQMLTSSNTDMDDEFINAILDLNVKYDALYERDEDISRNVNWRVKECRWGNLFNYGEENVINFDNLQGIVGIFGESFSGKTSAVETMLYTIFNSITKKIKKNYDIVNEDKEEGWGEVLIQIEGDNEYVYRIRRETKKSDKMSKGKLVKEGATCVFFERINRLGDVEILNGTDRVDTDRKIREKFGTKEDFLVTSFSSQFGFLSFIDEGSDNRKNLLSMFLDLEIFNKKFEIANERYKELKSILKKMDDGSHDKKMRELREQNFKLDDILEEAKESIFVIKEKYENKKQIIQDLKNKTKDVDIEILDIKKIDNDIKTISGHMASEKGYVEKLTKDIEEKNIQKEKIEKFFAESFNIDEYREKKKLVDKNKEMLTRNENLLQQWKTKLKTDQKKSELLTQVPCGDNFPQCKFIKDAFQASKQIESTEKTIASCEKDVQKLLDDLNDLNPEQVDKYILNYEQLSQKLLKLVAEISNLEMQKERCLNTIYKRENELKILDQQKEKYYQNEEKLVQIGELRKQIVNIEKEFQDVSKEYKDAQKNIENLYVKQGMIAQNIENILEKKKEIDEIVHEFDILEIYLKCMGKNGICSLIIRNALPFLNEEICRVLEKVVEFEVSLTCDDGKLDIYIQHSGKEGRIIELGSGAEKTLTAMAIRLALIKITTLPKSSMLILDEPALALSENLMEQFVEMLGVIKQDFDSVILISHLDELKESVDHIIEIEHDDDTGYAKINV